MRIKITRKLVGGLIVVGLVFGLYVVLTAQSGVVLEQWETSNGTFRVRVRRRPEVLNFLPRYYYEFQSQVGGSIGWQKITTLVIDDPVPVPRSQVRFVNSEIGYLFMSTTFAVTTNAGKHWAVFNVRTDPPLGQKDSYLIIRDVQIESDGTGKMAVYSKADGRVVQLRTNDHGNHWMA